MHKSTEAFVHAFYVQVLRRTPAPFELRQAAQTVDLHTADPTAMLQVLCALPQVQRSLGVPVRWPPGHFYSPVVDPHSVADYIQAERQHSVDAVAGITLDAEAMRAIWLRNLSFVQGTPFQSGPTEGNRFRTEGGPYPMGDAVILRMMINHLRPRRIIEIGSGYTTACILDSVRDSGLDGIDLTCIEPNADRLRSMLWPGDLDRIKLIEKSIQDVPADVVRALGPRDLLLIDSTHVLKTGSDVHHELFNLMPRLAVGVVVHVHDIMLGFEYPDVWVFQENYSWNEAYGWRAFLMYNTDFRVVFWNSFFARSFAAEIRRECPSLFPNPGSALWVERVARSV